MSNYKNQMKMYLESLERNAKLIELEIEREKTSIEFAKNIIKDRKLSLKHTNKMIAEAKRAIKDDCR